MTNQIEKVGSEKKIKLWIKRFEWQLIYFIPLRLGIRIQFFNWADFKKGEISI